MSWQILEGDTLSVLPTLEAGSVQTCITSPPYYGLRDYGHDGQIGLEQTPEQYVEKMVAVFREVRRVLRNDGTLWLNLGDSYAASVSAGTKTFGNPEFNKNRPSREATKTAARAVPEGLKPKDLIGIPWMVAFALRADGWYLRSDIIWHKPNPMPESVTDRPTKAHEYLFLLSKSARYYYNAAAIREPFADPVGVARARVTGERGKQGYSAASAGAKGSPQRDASGGFPLDPERGRNKRTVWTVQPMPFPGAHFATFPPRLIEPCVLAGSPEGGTVLDPFSGAGTTGVVALRNDREYIGVELNTNYAEMSRRRIEDDAPLFNCAETTVTREPTGEPAATGTNSAGQVVQTGFPGT